MRSETEHRDQSSSRSASMMLIRACGLSSGATASSRSSITMSAPRSGAFSSIRTLLPGTASSVLLARLARMPSFPAILNPPERLLCGPGPSNVSPAVLEAMQRPLLGHLDPDLHDILTELVATLRATWRAEGGLVLPLQATGTSGMETGLASLLEPGEVAIVAVNGFFGRRI